MNHGHRLLSAFKAIGLAWTLGMSVSACGSGSEKWKEEVQLSDGRVIVVERETIHERGGDEWALNRNGSKPKERRIRFFLPNGSGQAIEWRSTKISPQTWPEKPLILDIDKVQPTVYSLLAISPGCEVYVKYVYQNGAWVEEALPERFEQRTTNLFIRDGVDMPKFVNLETTRVGNAEIGYRRALLHVGPARQICGSTE
jgi:hypothetical protein